MATTSSSPLFDDIVRRLTGAGYDLASAGEAVNWLVRALHPAGGQACGPMPDASTASVITPDFTVQTTVSCPTGIGGDWDFLAVQPPGDTTGVIVLAGMAGTNFATAVPSAVGSNGADGGIVFSTLQTQSIQVIANMGNPAPIPGLIYDNNPIGWPVCTAQASGDVCAVRRRFAGLTVYPVASTLFDQGTIYAARISRSPVLAQQSVLLKGIFGSAYLPLGQHFAFNKGFIDLPFSETSMALLDPTSVAWPYRNGAYIPGTFLNPTNDFTPMSVSSSLMRYLSNVGGARDNTIVNGPVGTSYYGYLPTVFQPLANQGPFQNSIVATSLDIEALVTGNNNLSTFVDTFDTAMMPCSSAIVIGRGLAQQASVTIRVYMGLEYIPQVFSPILQFTRAAALPAARVMELYHLSLSEMGRTVYPSSWNSLGTILGAIGNAVRTALPIVSRVLPVLGAAVGLGGGGGGAAAAAPQRVHTPRHLEAPALRRGRREVTTMVVRKPGARLKKRK